MKSPWAPPRTGDIIGSAEACAAILQTNQLVAIGGDAIYEDECFIFDLRMYRRYTSINGDNGSTTVLLLLTFKTIGQFGYRAL